MDYVITVCDRAAARCPVFPGTEAVLHWSFEDPAAAPGSREEKLSVFRRVRDEIVRAIENGLREQVGVRSPGDGGSASGGRALFS
jgi:arsenate reductase